MLIWILMSGVGYVQAWPVFTSIYHVFYSPAGPGGANPIYTYLVSIEHCEVQAVWILFAIIPYVAVHRAQRGPNGQSITPPVVWRGVAHRRAHRTGARTAIRLEVVRHCVGDIRGRPKAVVAFARICTVVAVAIAVALILCVTTKADASGDVERCLADVKQCAKHLERIALEVRLLATIRTQLRGPGDGQIKLIVAIREMVNTP